MYSYSLYDTFLLFRYCFETCVQFASVEQFFFNPALDPNLSFVCSLLGVGDYSGGCQTGVSQMMVPKITVFNYP